MNILQSIFTDYYEHIIYELHPRPAVIENVNKMIHCVILLTVVPCMAVLTVEILNLFPFAVKVVFALPAETNTTSFVLFICPVSLFLAFIAIVFSLSQRNFAFIFSKTELS